MKTKKLIDLMKIYFMQFVLGHISEIDGFEFKYNEKKKWILFEFTIANHTNRNMIPLGDICNHAGSMEEWKEGLIKHFDYMLNEIKNQ